MLVKLKNGKYNMQNPCSTCKNVQFNFFSKHDKKNYNEDDGIGFCIPYFKKYII